MMALSVKIRLLEPLLAVEAGGGDPNSARTLSYIPGSALRGAVIGRYLSGKEPGSDLAGDPAARRLFFDGSVCYLNAYPCIPTGQRMLPTPLSWYVDKDATGDEIYDFAIPECDKPGAPRRVEQPFFYPLEGGSVCLRRPERHISIHTYRRERSGQNKNEDSVFRYEALAAGQMYGAFILADDANDLELLGRLLSPPDLSIGGSHRAGYGRVQLEVELVDWPGEYPRVDESDDLITVTCLSDTLVRSEAAPEAGAYVNSLAPILGLTHAEAFTRQGLAGGFNRKWGLPLPQAQAIQAGSVFVYDYTEALYRRLRYLEITGLGERRVEGFGRIAVNLQQNPTLAKKELRFGQPLPVQLSGAGFSLAQQMSERILRAGLNADLATTLAYLSINQPQPSNAQLARLRTLVRRILHRRDLTIGGLRPITGHLNNLKSPAAKQFDRARIEGKPLKSWLLQLIEKPQTVWDILRANEKKGPAIGQVQAELTDALACEYTLRLINGLLQQAGKGDNDE